MGLMTALNAAVSGLRTTQEHMNLVSQNVANANSVGYTRRVMSPVQQVAGDRTVGVRTGEVERVLDLVAQKQLRLETAGSAYTSFMAGFSRQLDRLFGSPGSAGSLDSMVNTFSQSLQALLSDPGSVSARSAVLDQASVLTSQMGRLSESVQALRTEAEGRIAIGIDRANELLSGISTANGRIVGGQSSDPALLDERDRMIDELSTLVDVQTIRNQNGSVSLVTTAGLTLFNGVTPVKLSFDGRTSLAPQSQYSTDPDTRSVGTITAVSANGVATDVIANRMIRSGEIAAAVEMRDQTLVEAQRQLDDLAAGMARALSDRPATATATGGGFNVDLAGMKPGNTIALDYRTGATSQRVILVAMNGPGGSAIPPGSVGAETDIVIPFDVNDAAASIQAGLTSRGIPLSATDPAAPSTSVRFTPNAGTTLTGASAAVTVTTFDSGYPQLPFFVDSGYGNTPFTGSFEGGSHLTGFAQRITMNPALSNRSHLVVYAPGTPQGDTVRPQFILDSLTKTSRAFPAASGIGGGAPVVSTVTGFARQVVETQGANAASAQRLDEGQSVALAAIESRFAEGSGVNIDQEMAQLVTLQMAYGANARVMTAVRDMMDMLMRM